MNTKRINKLIRSATRTISKHAPEILVALGVAGTASAIVMAVAATPKAINAIDAEIDRQNEEFIEEQKDLDDEYVDQITVLPIKDTIRVTWKYYIPTVVTAGVSIACIVGASKVNHKRNAALATAYELVTTSFDEYRDAVREEFGDEKEEVVRKQVIHKKVQSAPPIEEFTSIDIPGGGSTLMYDSTSCRYFKSDWESVREVVNNLNQRMMDEMFISLNDFYYEIGLGQTSIGDDLGWNISSGLIEIRNYAEVAPHNQPCLVLDFMVEPRYGFEDLH